MDLSEKLQICKECEKLSGYNYAWSGQKLGNSAWGCDEHELPCEIAVKRCEKIKGEESNE